MAQTTLERADQQVKRDNWYAKEPTEVLSTFGTNRETGLTAAQVQENLAKYGPNSLKEEKPPSRWAIMLQQLRDPMNLLLIAVTVVSILIGEGTTALLVGLLV